MLKQLKGCIILLITAIVWGSSFVAQSEGMNYVQPFTYNSIRTIIGGLVLIPVIFCFRAFGSKTERKPLNFRITLIGGVCCGLVLCIASSLQQFGIVQTTAGKSGFITALYVIFVPVIELLLGKRQRRIIWLCVLMAIVGFYLLCVNEAFTIGAGEWMTFACSVFFAAHIIIIDRFLAKGADGLTMACVQFLTAGFVMFICMLLFEQPNIENILSAKYTILYAGVLSCGVGYTLQIIGQRYTAPTVATLIMSLESVFSVLSGWLILGENLGAKELLGCCLVFTAVVLAQVRFPSRNNKKLSVSHTDIGG